ncbi:hypothetical protein [Streptomyces sp. NPDC001985]|uniref:hypothetical protein n=1 Tax=Streptomyces sp. NPDC001985 TaxID=3154406 RepID=UPI00331D8DE7
MNWSGHWHGYGPWTGSRDTYAQEALRRPGSHPEDPHTRAFIASPLPPMQTGHWLLRTGQTTPDRTWSALSQALAWLAEIHAAHPPHGRYPGVDIKLAHARDALPRGTDVVWVHYTRTQHLVSLSVVCCPQRFHPGIPCPGAPVCPGAS